MSPKTPRAPRRPLTYETSDLHAYGGPLWRIHATSGDHPTRWDEPRTFGPLDSRWDPHPPPTGEHPHHGVLYAGTDTTTTLGEIFQRDRIVDLVDLDRQLTGWEPTRDLVLLDLTDTWAVRQDASYALSHAPKSTCRVWASAIHDQLVVDGPRLDGLWVDSTITGRPMAVLFGPAEDSFPSAPQLSRPLCHDDLVVIVEEALDELGYGFC